MKAIPILSLSQSITFAERPTKQSTKYFDELCPSDDSERTAGENEKASTVPGTGFFVSGAVIVFIV